MIDTDRCMAKRDGAWIFGDRCQEPATHNTLMGRRCAHHAEEMRKALRDPNTLGNVLAGDRARTEEEIARLVVEIPNAVEKDVCAHCLSNNIRASLQTVTTARGEVQRCWQCGGEYRDGVRVWPETT